MRVRRFNLFFYLLDGSLRFTPLLAGWWPETEAEAQKVVAFGGLVPVPIRGTGEDKPRFYHYGTKAWVTLGE